MVSGDCGAPYDEYRGPGLRAEDKGDCKGSYEGSYNGYHKAASKD